MYDLYLMVWWRRGNYLITMNCKFSKCNCPLSVNIVMGSIYIFVCDRSSFYHWLGQTKDYKFVICCFFTKHAAFMSKQALVSRSWDNVNI